MFFSGLNLFLHAGQAPWIRDWLEKNWQKDSYGRKDGQRQMAFIIFIKGKREDGRSPN